MTEVSHNIHLDPGGEFFHNQMPQILDHQAALGRLLRKSPLESGWRVTNDSHLPLVALANGERWLRACITHHQTEPEDIRALVDALNRAFDSLVSG